jgi:PAS domain S-box-containing protein
MEVPLPKSRVAVLRPRFALFSVLICFFLSTLAIISWNFNIPILRTLIPGSPGMVPTTAFTVAVIGFSLLLSLPPAQQERLSRLRLTIVTALCAVVTIVAIGTLAGFIFGSPTTFNFNFLFSVTPSLNSVPMGANMSVQTSLATVFLTGAILLHLLLLKIENQLTPRGLRRGIMVIQLLPILTLGLCCLATIGYIQGIPRYALLSKFLGFSPPTLIAFTLLSVSALQLRRESGYIAILIGEGSAGLFLRRFLWFSVFGPLLITLIIAWGEANALYPDSFSMGLFVIFTIGALIATSIVTAKAIQDTEDQRIGFELTKGRVALRETEEDLRDTKDRLQFALDASGMGTWELYLTGTGKLLWSNTTEALFGLSPGEFSGSISEMRKYIHPNDRDRLFAAQNKAIAEHRDLDADFRCIKSDGMIRWLRVKGRGTYDINGKPLKIGGTIIDITREKFHQQTIENALQAAQSANDLKSNFLASMSHEIRTPLGAILGFTELLRDPSITQSEREEYLKIITRNGETLSQLINDILDLSKVEAGHMNIENIRFPLKTTVEDVVTLLRGKADKKGIALVIKYANGLPEFITSDPVRLKQILFNLVGNAIKFTPQGQVTINVHQSKSKILFDVKDTGIGIKPEQRQKLFRPFIQADGSITRRFGGTGLGLSLSRNLAHLLGGDVELRESNIGAGSVFRACIENRANTESFAEFEVAQDAKAAALANEKLDLNAISFDGFEILVVDDSLDNQNLIEHILKKRGAKTYFADDGLQATQKAKERHYDLILMDIQMPVMDGLAATKIVRREGFTGPIIALTAHAMKDTHAECISVGCTGFLSKPIDSKNLVKTIDRLLRRPQSSALVPAPLANAEPSTKTSPAPSPQA